MMIKWSMDTHPNHSILLNNQALRYFEENTDIHQGCLLFPFYYNSDGILFYNFYTDAHISFIICCKIFKSVLTFSSLISVMMLKHPFQVPLFFIGKNVSSALGISEKQLPIRFLGLPLFSSKLRHWDRISPLEKIRAKFSG